MTLDRSPSRNAASTTASNSNASETNNSQENCSSQVNQAPGNGSRRVTTKVTSLNSIEMLQGRENYNSWAFAMKLLLIREGSWRSAVNVADSVEVDEDLSEQALATIGLHIHKRNYSLIKNCRTAKEAWKALRTAFEDNGFSREIGLMRQLCNIWLVECQTVEEYVDKIMSTTQKLQEIGFNVDDRWLVGLLLKGLPDEYDPMVMSLENCGIKLTADAVKARILQNVQVPQAIRGSSDHGALAAAQKKWKVKVKCTHCGRKGHTVENCWFKNKKENNLEEEDSQSESEEYTKKGRNVVHGAFIAHQHKCHKCGKRGHYRCQCEETEDLSY